MKIVNGEQLKLVSKIPFGECMTKYLALAFLIIGFLAGDAYGEEEEVFYCADFTGAV